jgi:hypothetical protein
MRAWLYTKLAWWAFMAASVWLIVAAIVDFVSTDAVVIFIVSGVLLLGMWTFVVLIWGVSNAPDELKRQIGRAFRG